MPSHEARLKRLEKKAAKVDGQLKKLKTDVSKKGSKADIAALKNRVTAAEKDTAKIIKWIKLEAKWSEQVTSMLRLINWDALAKAYPGGGGTNPPQTPPSWPPPE